MPKSIEYKMDQNLMYFRLYSASATLNVFNLTNKIIKKTQQQGHCGTS